MTDRPSSGLQATQGERVLTITRLFDAPRALVFAAFVDPAHAIHWLGPTGYAMSHLEADLKRGDRIDVDDFQAPRIVEFDRGRIHCGPDFAIGQRKVGDGEAGVLMAHGGAEGKLKEDE